MTTGIKVKRGYDLRLKGEAENELVTAPQSKIIAIKPPDFHSVVPKLIHKRPGVELKAGDELFFSKYSDRVRFVSPVSGTLKEVVRGDRRRPMAMVVEADKDIQFKDFGSLDVSAVDRETLKTRIFESGCGAFIKQRPYDIVADPDDTPRDIYISACDTAPLAVDYSFILKDQQDEFQNGIDALAKLTDGTVYLAVPKGAKGVLRETKNVELIEVSGKHPAGNVSVQIQETEPIIKGERIWTVGPEDVAIIGRLLKTGRFDARRTVALVGSDADDRYYYRTRIGAKVSDIAPHVDDRQTRVISGNVLTGTKLSKDDYIGFYDNQLSLIPEGNEYRFFGWMPFTYNKIPSMAHTSFSWLFPKKKYEVNTNLNGEERSMVVTGEMESVMPLDIYPMYLLKACLAGDIEKMEELGVYEVAPEDFALVDFINTSKVEAQEIIRMGLDLMITEVG